MVWPFVTILYRGRYNLSSATGQSVRCIRWGRQFCSVAALSVSAALLLAMIRCSVVEAVSMETQPAGHGADSSHNDEATSCCTLLRFILHESSADGYGAQSTHRLTRQKLRVAVCSLQISTEPQTRLRSLRDRDPPVCLQIEPSVTPCGVRGPPGRFFCGDFRLRVMRCNFRSIALVSNCV